MNALVDFVDDDLLDACVADHSDRFLHHAFRRNDSVISNASTLILEEPIHVETYCRPSMLMVEIEYPNQRNGWVYRPDVGGPSLHRWERGGLLLTSRHTTCTKGMVVREACRNCHMKSVWRRECLEPCNAFYLDCLRDASEVNELALSVRSATTDEISRYTAFAPKLAALRKRVLDTQDKVTRNVRSLENLVLALRQRDNAASSAPLTFKSAEKPVQTTVLMPSPKRPMTIAHKHLVVASFYEKLCQAFSAQKMAVSLDCFRCLVKEHSSVFMEHSMLARSDALDALATLLSVPNKMQLFLKAVFLGWLQTLCDLHKGLSVAEMHLGFYVAPSLLFYSNIFNDSLLPAVIAQSNHRVFHSYAAACAQCKFGVKPVMIAFFEPFCAMVKGENMLPLGVTIGD